MLSVKKNGIKYHFLSQPGIELSYPGLLANTQLMRPIDVNFYTGIYWDENKFVFLTYFH